MIHGQVNANQEIILSFQVRGPNERTADIESALDTGFNGFLTLPPELVSVLQLPFWETSEFTLADGNSVAFNVHIATVLWDENRSHQMLSQGKPLSNYRDNMGHHDH